MPRKWIFILCSLAGFTLAVKTITVDQANPQIHYSTFDQSNVTYPTWSVTPPNLPGNCKDNAQSQTERVGDYATFTFTGTGVSVLGTIGVRRGLINFTLDGQETSFNRKAAALKCDQAIFSKMDLPDQQHVLVAELVGKEDGDGLLSIQQIKYTVPSNNTPIIVGATVGSVAFVALVVAGVWFYRRRRANGSATAFFDNGDLPPQNNGAGPIIPGMIATPFEWSGPPAQQAQERRTSREMGQYSDRPETMVSKGSLDAESHASPPSTFLKQGSSSGISSDYRRESKAGYVANNPDRRSGSSFGSPQVVGDEVLVDRIALRLAEIMQVRAGPPADLPPPSYEPSSGSASNSNGPALTSSVPRDADSKSRPHFTMSNVADTPSRSTDEQAMPQSQLGGQTLGPPSGSQPPSGPLGPR